jgi:exodeoxyribonuclease VII small subunit
MEATAAAATAGEGIEVTAVTEQPGGDLAALTFDAALEELERTVAELEAGGQPLERTIELYERGVALQQRCEKLLGEAELRVRRLMDGARGAIVEAELRGDETA